MSDEVKKAVDDLLNGTSVSSSGEWLQREYIRLLRREASQQKNIQIESKLENKQQKNDNGISTK